MEVHVDFERCDGHALCMGACPQVFSVSDMGDLELLTTEPDAALHGAVEQAVALCPTNAISIRR